MENQDKISDYIMSHCARYRVNRFYVIPDGALAKIPVGVVGLLSD